MGIDYRNVLQFGLEFDSYECALSHLVRTGKIDEDQYDEDLDCGEPSFGNLEWNVYNAYLGGPGVLGVSFSAKTLYTEPESVAKICGEVEYDLGEGCSMHEFVKVY